MIGTISGDQNFTTIFVVQVPAGAFVIAGDWLAGRMHSAPHAGPDIPTW